MALFILRVGVGLLFLLGHGLPKLMKWPELSQNFPDPIGLGSTVSASLAVFAEVICSILLILGIGTRFVAIPPFITMLVAFFIVHAADPFQKKELALLYGLIFLTLIIGGGGAFALKDRFQTARRS